MNSVGKTFIWTLIITASVIVASVYYPMKSSLDDANLKISENENTIDDLSSNLDQANQNIDDANSAISDARDAAWSDYDNMGQTLENLEDIENVY